MGIPGKGLLEHSSRRIFTLASHENAVCEHPRAGECMNKVFLTSGSCKSRFEESLTPINCQVLPHSCARIEVDGAGSLNKATYRRTGKAVERTHRTCESPNTKTDSHRDSRSVRSNIHTPQEQAVGGRTRSANATFFFFSSILLHPRGVRVVANPQQDDVKIVPHQEGTHRDSGIRPYGLAYRRPCYLACRLACRSRCKRGPASCGPEEQLQQGVGLQIRLVFVRSPAAN